MSYTVIMKKYNTSIFIFRKDFRLQDNTGLIAALQQSKTVIRIFIFTPEQVMNNQYASNNCIQFMVESLAELDDELKHKVNSRLFYFFGRSNNVIKQILTDTIIDAIFVNRDYTPYSKLRDEQINKICLKKKLDFQSYEDALLHDINTIKNGSGETYVKFTPYFDNAKKVKVHPPQKNTYHNYYNKKNIIHGELSGNVDDFYIKNNDLAVRGGRKNADKILHAIKKFNSYNVNRNYFNHNITRLSAYIKFGVVSIRELYYLFKKKLTSKNDLIKQLFWRDFYYNIMDNNPQIMSAACFKPEYEKIPWITYVSASANDKIMWKKWCDGTTGFPIVDAAMRELNTTGYMHNRGRMIVACFLTKNMFWHFSYGVKYFAQKLVDYDPSNNNGGWQWSASCGVDSMPYFRVFNPWIQSAKYDKNCTYIKKWIPELKNISNSHIHKWFVYFNKYNIYHQPMLDVTTTSKKAIETFKKYL